MNQPSPNIARLLNSMTLDQVEDRINEIDGEKAALLVIRDALKARKSKGKRRKTIDPPAAVISGDVTWSNQSNPLADVQAATERILQDVGLDEDPQIQFLQHPDWQLAAEKAEELAARAVGMIAKCGDKAKTWATTMTQLAADIRGRQLLSPDDTASIDTVSSEISAAQ